MYSILLFLAALIWGTAFVAQSVGMDYMGPFTFNAVRFLIGGLVLLPFAVMQESKVKKQKPDKWKSHKKVTLIGGLCCGIAICTASAFQQIGIIYTTVGKAGFVTALYIVLVPVFGLVLKKKPAKIIWLCAAMALVGLYLLCINESFTISKGDLLVFCCALIFTVHIMIIDYYSPKANGVTLSCIQFLFSGIASMIPALIFETPKWTEIVSGLGPILYTGIMSCGVAYTLQIIGQKNVEPAVASLILSMESVVSVLAGWIILGQALSVKEIIGCVFMFAAVILSETVGSKKTGIETSKT